MSVVVAGAITAMLLSQAPSAASSSRPLAVDGMLRGDHGDAPRTADGGVTQADGILPAGVTVFDDEYPAIAHLSPDLLDALRAAALDAAAHGIELEVNTGWRSPKYQDLLLREALAKYGSARAAARWVATPETSAHVSGDAVDIATGEAAAWLAEFGARHGLCQIYDNEPWHYELRSDAIDRGCPASYADPTQDPRMQQ